MVSLSQLIAIFCVSIDGFCCGAALALESFRLKLHTLIFMSAISTVMTYVVMKIGSLFFGIIPESTCNLLGAITFFFLGFMALQRSKVQYLPNRQHKVTSTFSAALLCGIAVAIDASVAAFSMSMEGADPVVFSILFGLSHLLCISAGYAAAGTTQAKKLVDKIPAASAIIFTILGIIRLM